MELSQYVTSFLHGKLSYGPVRRALSILFSVNIASFLFRRWFFEYELIDLTDLKSVAAYFVDGSYFIPLFIAVLVHALTWYLSETIFIHVSDVAVKKWSNKSVAYLEKSELLKSRTVARCYKLIREGFEKKIRASFHKEVNLQSKNVRSNFLLCFKAMLVSNIFFFDTVPHYGLYTFIITTVFFVATSIVMLKVYTILKVVPKLLHMMDRTFQEKLAGEALAGSEKTS